MKTPLSNIKPTLYAYILLGIAGLYLHFNFSQADISYFINKQHTPILDFICEYGTYLGDGWAYVVVCIILLFINRKVALVFSLAGIFSSLMAQGLKYFVFDNALRPVMMLDASQIHLIDGVKMNQYFSFPSGHTTAAFSMFALIGFYQRNILLKVLCLLPALFIGYTRIYLLQHFFEDVLFGSMLGVFTSMIVYYTAYIFKPKEEDAA